MTIINNKELVYSQILLFEVNDKVDVKFKKNETEMNFIFHTYENAHEDDESKEIVVFGKEDRGEVHLYRLNEKKKTGFIDNLKVGAITDKQLYLSMEFSIYQKKNIKMLIQFILEV